MRERSCRRRPALHCRCRGQCARPSQGSMTAVAVPASRSATEAFLDRPCQDPGCRLKSPHRRCDGRAAASSACWRPRPSTTCSASSRSVRDSRRRPTPSLCRFFRSRRKMGLPASGFEPGPSSRCPTSRRRCLEGRSPRRAGRGWSSSLPGRGRRGGGGASRCGGRHREITGTANSAILFPVRGVLGRVLLLLFSPIP